VSGTTSDQLGLGSITHPSVYHIKYIASYAVCSYVVCSLWKHQLHRNSHFPTEDLITNRHAVILKQVCWLTLILFYWQALHIWTA